MQIKSIALSAALVMMAASVAGAQPQYPQYQDRQPHPLSKYPPSWSYDPYTSGLAACPQWAPDNSQPCSELLPPTYGQPDYWPRLP